MIVQSWDTASKVTELCDFSVCTVWLVKGEHSYLIDCYRAKIDFPTLRSTVVMYADKYAADMVIIEDCSTGTELLQEFEGCDFCDRHELVGYKPVRNKVVRMHARTAIIEAGRVHLPKSADWLNPLLSELLQFPNGSYDDQVDSIAQFLHCVQSDGGYSPDKVIFV